MSAHTASPGLRLGDIARELGGELIGEAGTHIARVATLEAAGPGDIAFLANARYQSQVAGCAASALILPPSARELARVPCILTADPYVYFARLAQLLSPPPSARPGVAPGAVLASEVPASAEIGPGAWIGEGVVLGEGVMIGAGCLIGDGVVIGAGSRLYPGVSVYPGCRIGERCILHSGAVIGADGFGFARGEGGAWIKIPQTGRVLIGDEVEVGANTTIDRGALDDTVIASGVKLDNQIQIGHNVHLGRDCIVAAATAIAGSTRIGERCMIGGGSAIAGHLTIADDVVISGATTVIKSIRSRGTYTSTLAQQPHQDWTRNFAHLRRLDAMAERLRALEKKLSELEQGSNPR